ncbi:DUF3106 domain-containing protein [Arenimonas sp.]|uniref:DUF3106 domain-containing protein n=1 Tax=Arenimonas sp. TaxID=1872635 RepID=UPI0039E3AFD0
MKSRWLVVICIPFAFAALAATAGFSALPEAQRRLLASAEAVWPVLPPEDRRALQDNAADWLARSPQERAGLHEAWRRWQALPPAERARRRGEFEAWRRLPESEKRTLRDAAPIFSALPVAEQQRLREEFAQLPVDEQLAWSLGPELGRDAARMTVLFAYVPEAERPQLLQVLRELTPDERALLAQLVPRLDARRRDRLRESLLKAPAGERAALLRATLAAQ